MAEPRFPVFFVSHGGGPWPWVDGMRQQYAKTERGFSGLPALLPARPAAVLVISGHWEAPAFTVSTSPHPPMEYDYSGFPEHTYHIRYPAPGAPAVARRVAQLLDAAGIECREDARRGFDHGTFVPLALMYPKADVPIVMLSMKSGYSAAEHLRLGAAITALRDEGVLILGSGLSYHNMRGFGRPESGAVAAAFENYLNAAVAAPDPARRNDMLLHWTRAPGARLAHPHEDHLIPLLVAAGAAGNDVGKRVFVDQVMEVAMASYGFGLAS
ncbi:MAG: class III extradiol ring-cleavage dioxygenase [Burkholderiaceae bacterium]